MKYCEGCGYEKAIKGRSFCHTCESMDKWPHKHLSYGDEVNTPYGRGVVVGLDLPTSSTVWRWKVLITHPTSSHFLVSEGKPMCFVDNEVKAVDR